MIVQAQAYLHGSGRRLPAMRESKDWNYVQRLKLNTDLIFPALRTYTSVESGL